MKIVFFGCSKIAYKSMQLTAAKWAEIHPEDSLQLVVKCKALPDVTEERSLSDCVAEAFQTADALIFFTATGIAVRLIAPYVTHKAFDPAVVVFDEACNFGISLLSGHLGGANALTAALCAANGAQPVITTASDGEGHVAIDVFAKEHHLVITDYEAAKDLEASILAGEKIGFWDETGMFCGVPDGEECAGGEDMSTLPEEFATGEEANACKGGILISTVRAEALDREVLPFQATLQLIPRCVCLGIGCKKYTPEEKIEAAVRSALTEENVDIRAVRSVGSIDLKAEEEGLLGFCRNHHFAFHTFPSEELQSQEGDFSSSEFVQKVTGVDNVCERSVVAQGAKLIASKKVLDGVTVAIGMLHPEQRTGASK